MIALQREVARALGIALVCMPVLRAQWVNRGNAPAATSAVYDSVSQQVLALGNGPTMGWNGSAWTQVAVAPPPNCMFAFDRRRGVLVGYDPHASQTYELGGGVWTRRFPTHAPGFRNGPGFLYHERASACVLFGGYAGGVSSMADTWHYDGNDWQLVTYGLRRHNFMFYYDSARGVAIAVAGFADYSFFPVPEIEAYDGVTWRRLGSSFLTVMGSIAHDRAHGRAVILRTSSTSGGYWFSGLPGHYELQGITTTARTDIPQPFAVNSTVSLAFDEARNRLVAIGATTQELTPEAASASFGAACIGTGRVGARLTTTMPRIGQPLTATLNAVQSGETAVFVFGFSRQLAGGTPLPTRLDSLGLTGCSAYISVDQLAVEFATGTTVAHSEPVPNLADLVGLPVYCQALHQANGQNPASALTSNAVELLLGV